MNDSLTQAVAEVQQKAVYAVSVLIGNPNVLRLTSTIYLRKPVPLVDGETGLFTDATAESGQEEEEEVAQNQASTLLLMYGIPARTNLQELYAFLEASMDDVQYLQVCVLQGHDRDVYSVLLQCTDAAAARTFREEYHNKCFNSLEPEQCLLLPVVLATMEARHYQWFPMFSDATQATDLLAGLTVHRQSIPAEGKSVESLPLASPSSSPLPQKLPLKRALSSEAALQVMGINSLEQQCPVCLEAVLPVSATTAVVTILCTHVFHLGCLAKWSDQRCPVCRYTLQPDEEPDCSCSWPDCASRENLWICLVCGHVGCGRYQNEHAVQHFEQTGHNFSLDVMTRRVWDYVSDGFVHRLILNQTEDSENATSLASKPVELLRRQASLHHNEGSDFVTSPAKERPLPELPLGWRQSMIGLDQEQIGANLKLESLLREYTHLLDSQLCEQRQFFERTLQGLKKNHAKTIELLQLEQEAAKIEVQNVQSEVQNAEAIVDENDITLEELVEAKTAVTVRLGKLKKLNKVLTLKQAQHQKDIDDALTQNDHDAAITELKTTLVGQDAQIQELKETMRDMQIYLRTQKQVRAHGGHKKVTLRATNNKRRKKR